MSVRGALRVNFAMLASAALIAVAPATASAADANCANADDTDATATTAQLAASTLCLINAERQAAGRTPLSTNATLEQTASAYANRINATQRFDHVDVDGHHVADRVTAAGGSLAAWDEIGENLGWGSMSSASPRALVRGWMDSPAHRDNILHSSFDRLGVGIAAGSLAADSPVGLTYVTVFGDAVAPKPAKPKRKRCSKSRTSKSRKAGKRTRKATACRTRKR